VPTLSGRIPLVVVLVRFQLAGLGSWLSLVLACLRMATTTQQSRRCRC
jgi:hypothetical protein